MYVFCSYIETLYKLGRYKTYIQLPANWNGFCMFFVHTNNVKTIQNLYNKLTETTVVWFLYIKTMYKLYKMHTNVNRIIYAAAADAADDNTIFRSISHFCKIYGPLFSYSKGFTGKFILKIYLSLL